MLSLQAILLVPRSPQNVVQPVLHSHDKLIFFGSDEIFENQIMLFESVQKRWINLFKPVLHDVHDAVKVGMHKASRIKSSHSYTAVLLTSHQLKTLVEQVIQ